MWLEGSSLTFPFNLGILESILVIMASQARLSAMGLLINLLKSRKLRLAM